MIDINLLIAIGVTATLVVLIRFVFPHVKDDLYTDIKRGLLLFGYAFRDDKLKEIADMLFNIVVVVEQLDKDNLAKQYEAIETAQARLLDEFDIAIDVEALKLIVDIAVAYLPKTNGDD